MMPEWFVSTSSYLTLIFYTDHDGFCDTFSNTDTQAPIKFVSGNETALCLSSYNVPYVSITNGIWNSSNFVQEYGDVFA